MYHTSPSKITENMINGNGVAGDCLFFSDDVYVMTASNTVYVYEADFNCVCASELHDDDIIEDIASYFDVDVDIAESLLDGSGSEWDHGAEGEDSWWLQGKRGECAVKMGFDGCEDEDEQGVVYIIPMKGRESDLTLVEVRD